MGKNFGKAGSIKVFEDTKKTEQEKAQVITLKSIRSENLLDYPKNGEDISFTADLEESMRQNGFTDPIEVTDFGMADGKYMIVSGHRRRASGEKVFGKEFAFPCLIRHFESDDEVYNYVLFANSQRDSARDPLLFCGRYKMHEEYLESIGFKGNKREEVAKRLGISVQQADRYNAMNKIILPVHDMVRAEIVGMSSVQPMASHKEEEQVEIYGIMQDALKNDVRLSRDTVKKIVDSYRSGKKTWAEIADLPRDSGIPLNAFMNTEPSETREPSGESNRNDEVRHEVDPIGAEYDKMDADREAWERDQMQKDVETEVEDEVEEVEENSKETQPLTAEEKAIKQADMISHLLEKLSTELQKDHYKCKDEDSAKLLLANMKSVSMVLIDEMYAISEEYDLKENFDSAMKDFASGVSQYE